MRFLRRWYYRTFWLKSITKKIRELDSKRGYHDARGIMSIFASAYYKTATGHTRLANKYRKQMDKLLYKI